MASELLPLSCTVEFCSHIMTYTICDILVCEYFTIPFGNVEFVGTGYDSVAMVTCHPGYTMWGPATVVCQNNNMWSRKPICDATGNSIRGTKIEPPRGKTNNVVSEQVRHKPASTSTEKS